MGANSITGVSSAGGGCGCSGGNGANSCGSGCSERSLSWLVRGKVDPHHCLFSPAFIFFLSALILVGSVAYLYAWLVFTPYDRTPYIRTGLSSLGCQEDNEGSWSIGVYFGDSPFLLQPIEDKNVWRDKSSAWPVANPVVTCASASAAGFPSNFVADPFLYIMTGKSKHYGFIEFEVPEVAKVVADAMHNQLLFNHLLQVYMVPSERIHPRLWKHLNRNRNPVDFLQIETKRHNKERTLEEHKKLTERILKRDRKRRKNIEAAGIDYECPEVVGADQPLPKKIKFVDE